MDTTDISTDNELTTLQGRNTSLLENGSSNQYYHEEKTTEHPSSEDQSQSNHEVNFIEDGRVSEQASSSSDSKNGQNTSAVDSGLGLNSSFNTSQYYPMIFDKIQTFRSLFYRI